MRTLLKSKLVKVYEKPEGFENDLGEYEVIGVDGSNETYSIGEVPISWGFKILHHLGEERFGELGKYGELVCGGYSPYGMSTWYLVVKILTIDKAIKLYGKPTKWVTGPRGGWRSITFGERRFSADQFKHDYSKYLLPICE